MSFGSSTTSDSVFSSNASESSSKSSLRSISQGSDIAEHFFAGPRASLDRYSSGTPSVYNGSASGSVFNGFPSPVSSNCSTLTLNPSVTLSFYRSNKHFRLRYARIDVCKDAMGNLESIQLSEASGFHMHTVHKFPNTKRPVPHVEQPVTATKDTTYSVSFLGPQTITAAQTSFDAQPHYTFESRSDFERFQETVFDQQLLFIAGVSEIKSKGRGEECISQNLRLLRAKNGRQTLLYFANSQKKEKKRYVSLPLDSIDRMNQAPKPGKPATLRLRPNTDQLTQLKTVYITFLDDIDQKTFWALLCAGVGSAS